MPESPQVFLLDGNLLVALRIDTHEHHEIAIEWFGQLTEQSNFATCAITEGTLIRVHMVAAQDRSAAAAWEALSEVRQHQQHRFWNTGFSYGDVAFRGLTGGKQVTDAWLAELARKKQATLATLDAGLAVLHKDVALLVQ